MRHGRRHQPEPGLATGTSGGHKGLDWLQKKPDSYGGGPAVVADNTLNREFDVDVPDQLWVTDITYSQSFAQIDPWAERVAGRFAHEFAPLSTLPRQTGGRRMNIRSTN